MPYQLNAKIVKNKKIADKIYNMVFHAPPISQNAVPGQFVHIKCSHDYEPLLRRPFSIQQVESSGNVAIIYKIVGRGTSNLTKFSKSQEINIIGPLGNHFLVPERLKQVFIVAGGMGIAPLSFLIDFMVEEKIEVLDNIELVFGVKSSLELIMQDKFDTEKVNLHLVTEDGSVGEKGTAIEVFRNLLQKYKKSDCIIYAGGPIQMLRKLSYICEAKNLPAQIAYENTLACGIGACLGCVIETKSGYQRVCRDGPIFDINQIKW